MFGDPKQFHCDKPSNQNQTTLCTPSFKLHPRICNIVGKDLNIIIGARGKTSTAEGGKVMRLWWCSQNVKRLSLWTQTQPHTSTSCLQGCVYILPGAGSKQHAFYPNLDEASSLTSANEDALTANCLVKSFQWEHVEPFSCFAENTILINK